MSDIFALKQNEAIQAAGKNIHDDMLRSNLNPPDLEQCNEIAKNAIATYENILDSGALMR